MRPKQLPIKKLKAHIASLKRQHNITLRYGSPHHDEIRGVTYIPRISTTLDYIVALHEIGHALDIRITWWAEKVKNIKLSIDEIEIEGNNRISPKRLRQLTAKLDRLAKKTDAIQACIDSNKWTWENERTAWRYAFKQSLVWNKQCKMKVEECLRSYWVARKPKQNWSLQKIMDHYQRFYLKYTMPVFTE